MEVRFAFIFKKTEWNVQTNPFMFKRVNEEFYLLKKLSRVIFNGQKNKIKEIQVPFV